MKQFSKPIGLDDTVNVDLVIIGSVAVSPKGLCLCYLLSVLGVHNTERYPLIPHESPNLHRIMGKVDIRAPADAL